MAVPKRSGDDLTYASVATGRQGDVYVAWTDQSRYGVRGGRSVDGGRHFAPEVDAAAFSIIPIPHCGIGIVVPAEPRSCIQANPTVAVDTDARPLRRPGLRRVHGHELHRRRGGGADHVRPEAAPAGRAIRRWAGSTG